MTPTIATARPQHEQAHERANQIRFAMSSVRREVAALPYAEGCLRAAELIEDPDEIVGRMRVEFLLRAIRQVGRNRAQEIARLADASTLRRIGPVRVKSDGVGPLSLRQRSIIAGELRRMGGER